MLGLLIPHYAVSYYVLDRAEQSSSAAVHET